MLITGERGRNGRRIDLYLVNRGGEKRATQVVEKLFERGWEAEVQTQPTLAIATSAPPRMFDKAWNAS